MRSDKTTRNYLAAVQLTASRVWLKATFSNTQHSLVPGASPLTAGHVYDAVLPPEERSDERAGPPRRPGPSARTECTPWCGHCNQDRRTCFVVIDASSVGLPGRE